MEHKSVSIELKDFSAKSRTAIVAHAVYDNIDRVGDISRKGMFTKSWKESPLVDFWFNHDPKQVPGTVTRTFEDETKAYSELKFGNWTLGNDVLEMADAGVIKGVSFGYVTEKKAYLNIKGKKVRELKEVRHIETSLLTVLPANPEAGIISLTKSLDDLEIKKLSISEQDALKKILLNDQSILEQLVALSGSLDSSSDLYTWINWNISRRSDAMADIRGQLKWNAAELTATKAYINKIENFCRNSHASDECIMSLQNDVASVKSIIYDTASTHLADEQDASVEESKDASDEVLARIKLLTISI